MQKESPLAIFLTFLRFGLMAWGGPVAQIHMIREELVDQKQWVDAQKFKRVLAVYQALPGPEAHELCVYFGMVRGGGLGGFLAGLGFMLPGFVLMLLLSWAYMLYGAEVLFPIFAGVSPAVVALMVRATHRLGSHTLQGIPLMLAGLLAFVATLAEIHFLLVLAFCAMLQVLWRRGKKLYAVAVAILLGTGVLAFTLLTQNTGAAILLPASIGGLFGEGLKAGLFSFGGAYTAIPFLHDSMVGVYPAITSQSFLDGIALGNIIPAPLVIFGTYLGFLAGGFWGALLMTAGIFLPAFLFTLLGHNYLEKLTDNALLHGALDGISAGVVGILVVTTLQIGLHTLASPVHAMLFVLALGALYLWKWRWAVPVVILGCGVMGWFIL